MSDQQTQVTDQFNAGAATWHRSSGLLDPITPALAARLGPVPSGGTVLDVACGRGEPGLSLVEATPGVRLVGVDVAHAMIDGARAEAAGRAIADTRFEVGSAEELPVDDGSVDAVVSRMGMFGFPGSLPDTAREAFRVLRPGGRLAVAVWGRAEGQTALAASVAACREAGGAEPPEFVWMDQLADGRRERWLTEAGFTGVVAEPLSWAMHFADLDALWGVANSAPPLASAFAALDDAARATALKDLAARLARHGRPDGSYAVPVHAWILTAVKPG